MFASTSQDGLHRGLRRAGKSAIGLLLVIGATDGNRLGDAVVRIMPKSTELWLPLIRGTLTKPAEQLRPGRRASAPIASRPRRCRGSPVATPFTAPASL